MDLNKLSDILQSLDDRLVKLNADTPEGSIEESVYNGLHEILSELIEEIKDEADNE